MVDLVAGQVVWVEFLDRSPFDGGYLHGDKYTVFQGKLIAT